MKSHNRNLTRTGEGGYTLVALLALMTILALALSAAAPSIRQQTQRTLEQEAIARGEEVAEAIRAYARRQGGGGTLPTSMEQLKEGIPFGIKKIQILRATAAIDPLSSSGEWRLIRPKGNEMIEFQQAVMLYAGGRLPQTRDALLQQYLVQITGLVDTGEKEEAPGGEDDSTNSTGPFIGVASRSRRQAVLTYYGIDRHDKWVFTPLFR
jgi:type II secretory pathway pseudopilin PulG